MQHLGNKVCHRSQFKVVLKQDGFNVPGGDMGDGKAGLVGGWCTFCI